MIVNKPKNPIFDENIIKKSLENTKNSLASRRSRMRFGSLSVKKVISVFNSAFLTYGYGEFPPMVTKETEKKLMGTIKLVKREYGESGQNFYKIIEDMVRFWSGFLKEPVYTVKSKPYVLSSTPNLKDFVNCREFFISELQKLECSVEVEPETFKRPRSLF